MRNSVVIAESGYNGKTAPLIGEYEKILPLAKEIGYEAIQLSVNRPAEQPVDVLQKLLDNTGLAISSIATGMGYTQDGLSICHADVDIRKKAVNRMKEHIHLSTMLGGTACAIIGTIRGFVREAGSPKAYMNYLKESCAELIEYAEKSGILIVLESNDHYEADMFIHVDETLDFVRSFKSKYFKLQLDTMHMYNEGEDIVAAVRSAGDTLGQLDLSGVDRTVPQKGVIDFSSIIATVKENGYDGYLVYEFAESKDHLSAINGLKYIKESCCSFG